MRGCAKYLDGLVEDVIDFAQIEAGRAALRLDWYCPDELVGEVIAITRAEADLSGATVRAEPASGLPDRILGDAGRVRQILVNLTFNAIRHAGGTVAIRCRAGTEAAATAVEFVVADEGPGIAADDQVRLFEPFSRLEAPGRLRVPGSGLGLANSRRWAEIMGGTLTVVSQPGAGARFRLAVPYDPALRRAVAAAARLTLRRVLLVEDEDYNAWAAEAVAARVGLQIVARARTGAEALAAFAAGRFDVLLLDRVLPDGDGTGVCRALRAQGASVKIIALTASATAEDRAACLAAGMDAFVSKPLTPEKLVAALQAVEGVGASENAAINADQRARRSRSTDLTSSCSADLATSLSVDLPASCSPDLAVSRSADLTLLRYLSDGSAEGLAREVQRYGENLAEAEAALGRVLNGGPGRPATDADLDAIRGCVHRLHGLLRMVEANPGCAAAAAIERSSRQGQTPPAELVDALTSALDELRAELSRASDPRKNPAPGRNAAVPPAT